MCHRALLHVVIAILHPVMSVEVSVKPLNLTRTFRKHRLLEWLPRGTKRQIVWVVDFFHISEVSFSVVYVFLSRSDTVRIILRNK